MSTLNVFISYSRKSDTSAKNIASDILALGYSAWYDKELSGGQTWWDQILDHIRDCRLFVLVLDPESLNSTACKREYTYAASLGKPILPVLVSDEISDNLLPQALSKIQYVDYRSEDRDAALRLARAIATAPPAPQLPDPLPPPPEVPLSYVGSLAESVETSVTLSFEEQSALVVDLKSCLHAPDTADDARMLLTLLRRRRDLYAPIADEIDSLLGSFESASHRSARPKNENVSARLKNAFGFFLPGSMASRSGFFTSAATAKDAEFNTRVKPQSAQQSRPSRGNGPTPHVGGRVRSVIVFLLRSFAILFGILFALGLISTLSQL